MTPRLAEAMGEHFARYRLALYDGQRTPWLFHHTITNRRRKAGDVQMAETAGFGDGLVVTWPRS